MFNLTDEQIKKAAEWWADHVARPTFKTLSDEERSDPGSQPAAFAELLAHALVEPITEEQREKFISALSEDLKNSGNSHWGLSVDYGPDQRLSMAADKAGISSNNFPWKTNMWFDEDGGVTVSLGYGGERQKL